MRIFRNRQGQIRGVDFSMSMIIFLLVMSQIFLLTNSFISSNKNYVNTTKQKAFADALSDDILFSQGSYQGSDWGTLPSSYISGNWDFGLSSNGTIDPFKINRLSNWSLQSMQLTYNQIANGLNLENKSFQIEIYNPINVTIDSVNSVSLPTFTIVGTVYQGTQKLSNAKIYLFTVNTASDDVDQIQTITNTTGQYSVTIDITNGNLLTNNYLTIVVIAQYGISSQDTAILNYAVGSPPSVGYSNISILHQTSSTNGYGINIAADRSGTSSTIIALYPGIDTTSQNYTKDTTPTSTTDNSSAPVWLSENMAIPSKGTVVVIMYEFNSGVISNFAYINYPTSIDNELSKIIRPTEINNAITTSITTSFLVRELLMTMVLTIWED